MLHQIVVTFEGTRPPLATYVNTEEFHFDNDQLLAFMSGMWWMGAMLAAHHHVTVTATRINGSVIKKLVYLGGYGPREVE